MQFKALERRLGPLLLGALDGFFPLGEGPHVEDGRFGRIPLASLFLGDDLGSGGGHFDRYLFFAHHALYDKTTGIGFVLDLGDLPLGKFAEEGLGYIHQRLFRIGGVKAFRLPSRLFFGAGRRVWGICPFRGSPGTAGDEQGAQRQ